MLDEMLGIKNRDKAPGSSANFAHQTRLRFANSSGLGETQEGTALDENLISQSHFN